MRATTIAAGGLACAGAAMTIAAFAGGGGGGGARGAAPNAPAANSARPTSDGLSVWVAHGCGSCHTFAPAGSSAPIGPDLTRTLKGKDRDYVTRAIVAPNVEAAPGYSPGGMPTDFATRIPPRDLQRLVDFIVEGVAAQ